MDMATWMQMGGNGGLLTLAFALGRTIPMALGAALAVWKTCKQWATFDVPLKYWVVLP